MPLIGRWGRIFAFPAETRRQGPAMAGDQADVARGSHILRGRVAGAAIEQGVQVVTVFLVWANFWTIFGPFLKHFWTIFGPFLSSVSPDTRRLV